MPRRDGTPAILSALGAMAAMVAGCAPEIGPGAEGSAAANGAPAESAPPASPVRRMPAPPVAEPGGAPEVTYTMVTVRAGAELEVEFLDPIRADDLRPGDAVKFGVTRPLIENHMVLVPLNSLINGEITAVETVAGGADGEEGDGDEAGGGGGHAMVKVHFVDVFFNGESWPISASVVEVMPGPGGGAAAGGAARANLGRVLAGGRQGAVAGAAAGAARGSAILLAADGAGAALPAGTILRLRLDEPLVFGLPNT